MNNDSPAAIPIPRIGITVGDPAGIGPEISLRAVRRPEVLEICHPVLIGDAGYLLEWARRFGIDDKFDIADTGAEFSGKKGGVTIATPPSLASLDNVGKIEMGREQPLAGRVAALQIEAAVNLCLQGRIEAMATAPINKQSLRLAGLPFPGHTEYLASLTHCHDFAMAFFSPRLRVALLTIHVALREVPALVRQADLERLIRLADRELRLYGIADPRIAVAGLNPHAGEGGLFGDEEAREIVPAIAACRQQSIAVTGPWPADTIFLRAVRGEFDLVISCYHDQGLIPIKCFAFGEAVNVTLGLPIVRTSVDHGTAFDLAGRGCADESSMAAAIILAAQLASARLEAGPGRQI